MDRSRNPWAGSHKKLKAVARLVFGRATASDQLKEDLVALANMSETEADNFVGRPANDVVLPNDMQPLVDLVFAARGQWRMASAGFAGLRPVGLDLTAVDVAARWIGITPDATMMADLQVIENEALNLMRAA